LPFAATLSDYHPPSGAGHDMTKMTILFLPEILGADFAIDIKTEEKYTIKRLRQSQ
jgi:hypothetical protein